MLRAAVRSAHTAAFRAGDDYEAAIKASYGINIYDTSELYAEVERRSSSTCGHIAAISCREGTINVYGGKLTGICYMGGKQSDGFPECFAIQMDTLNISGGGVVEARIKTASGQKDYRRSIAIGQYDGKTGTINFKGKGVLRTGVEMKNPNGGQRVIPESFNLLNNTCTRVTDLKMEDREVVYIEYTNVENGEIPAITVESGDLTLWLRNGKTYSFTKPIEVKSGATLNIFGFGTVNGLDVRGGGTVVFKCGTVTGGKEEKSLKMIVEGGNVNVDYAGQATDADGVKVWKQTYLIGNENASFSSVSRVSVRNGRSYSVYGTHPIDGRKVCLWMQSAEEPESLSAVPSGYSSSLTLKGQLGNPLWLTLFQSIATNERTLYVATSGMSVTIQPFVKAPTAEQMKDYKRRGGARGYRP